MQFISLDLVIRKNEHLLEDKILIISLATSLSLIERNKSERRHQQRLRLKISNFLDDINKMTRTPVSKVERPSFYTERVSDWTNKELQLNRLHEEM